MVFGIKTRMLAVFFNIEGYMILLKYFFVVLGHFLVEHKINIPYTIYTIYVLAVRFPERFMLLLVVMICSTIEFPLSSISNTSVSSAHIK